MWKSDRIRILKQMEICRMQIKAGSVPSDSLISFIMYIYLTILLVSSCWRAEVSKLNRLACKLTEWTVVLARL
jgi:hypothetical protein